MGSCICSAQTPPSLLLQLTVNFMIFDKIEHLQRAKSCPPGYLWWCCICCMHIHGKHATTQPEPCLMYTIAMPMYSFFRIAIAHFPYNTITCAPALILSLPSLTVFHSYSPTQLHTVGVDSTSLCSKPCRNMRTLLSNCWRQMLTQTCQ